MSPVRSKALSAIWQVTRKTQAAGRAREAAGTVQNLYGQAKDAARDAGDAAVSYAKDAYENSGETFRDGSEAVAKKVQDNPLGALLIAGGIGFALAMLMTRPPRRPPPALAVLRLSDRDRHPAGTCRSGFETRRRRALAAPMNCTRATA